MHLDEQEYSKEFDLSLWKKLLKYIVPYKKDLTILFCFIIGIGAIDAIYPLFTKYAVDTFIVGESLKNFVPFCAVLAATAVLQAMNVRFMIKYSGKIEASVPHDLRMLAFKKLQELPLTYYDRTPTGWLMARMTSDIKRLGTSVSWNLVDMVWALSIMLLMLILMFTVNWTLALIVLAALPFLAAISLYFQSRILKKYREVRKLNSHVTNAFSEGIMGAKTVKTMVREQECLEEFSGLTKDFRDYSVKSATLSSIYTPAIMLLGSIATALVLWKGGVGVNTGAISLGTMLAFISYTSQFFEPVKQFARVFNELLYSQASAERVFSLIETEADIVDSSRVVEKYGDMFYSSRENWPGFNGNIRFDHVSFSYKDGENVLEDFTLDIRAGETIALVGETGAGKTTIVNLACRFYEPTSGSILIDGVDYRERPLLWLYSNLGYVLQEPHLFSGTVKDNIAYGRPDVKEEEVIEAAKLVNAHEFIMKLEKGYDTEVGERGGRLSTGQKQLISFARAILANPGMFVLDEATSSVDTETEQLIQEAIHKVLEGRTSFIIAHRLSTIRSADRILVIDKGRVLEEGTHRQLLQKKGYYYRLYTNQFMEEQQNRIYDEKLQAV
jgi:ATP-binding cassette subfamily B protein